MSESPRDGKSRGLLRFSLFFRSVVDFVLSHRVAQRAQKALFADGVYLEKHRLASADI